MMTEVRSSSERKCTNTPALVVAVVLIFSTVTLVILCWIVGSKTTKINLNHEFTSYSREILDALKSTWFFILIMCFVAFIFSYIFLILFRHAAKYVIWIINILFVILTFAVAGVSFYFEDYRDAFIFGGIGLILIGMIIYNRKKIGLVAKIFKEASRALIDVPAVMFEPILTFISLLITSIIFLTFTILIVNAVDNQPISLTYISLTSNIISFIFITQFIIGCQNYVIAGTICRWYFGELRTPIKKSFSHLINFHLGSICLGAILMTILKLISAVLDSLNDSDMGSCVSNMVEDLLSFMVRNVYVVIAKEGTPFCESGKRAYRLLMNNIRNVIALNHFGDIVLMVCRLLVVLIAGTVGYTMLSQNSNYVLIPMIFGCILAFLIAHCFVMVFEMTVDTIFISFCIDIQENDGKSRPYYMSDSLKWTMMKMAEHSGDVLRFGSGRKSEVPIRSMQREELRNSNEFYDNVRNNRPYTIQSISSPMQSIPQQIQLQQSPNYPQQAQELNTQQHFMNPQSYTHYTIPRNI